MERVGVIAQPRLRSFQFRVRRDDGGEPFAFFYASSPAIAKKYANTWAAARGFTVALVPNEVVWAMQP